MKRHYYLQLFLIFILTLFICNIFIGGKVNFLSKPYYLAPDSFLINFKERMLNSNDLLKERTYHSISKLVRVEKIDEIADDYIKFLDSLFTVEKRGQKTIRKSKKTGENYLKIKILFDNDSDGLASAKVVETFLEAYGKQSGIKIIPVFEARDGERGIDRKGVDAVFVLDLFWSQMVEGVDMAIDHHRPRPDEEKIAERFTAQNKRLVNLKEVGYTGKESKYMPAAVLSTIVLDYTLKKKGLKQGLLSVISNIPLAVFLDGAILGDMAYPQDFGEGFTIYNQDNAKAISFIAECGQDGVTFLLEATKLDEVIEKYNLIKQQFEDRLQKKIALQTQKILQDLNQDAVGIFLSPEDISLKVDGFDINITSSILGACCNVENKSRAENKRRVLAVAITTVYEGKNILKFSLRFDGRKDIFSLKHVSENLRQKNPQKYEDGGGHTGAMALRIPLGDIKANDERALLKLNQETFRDILEAVVSSKKQNDFYGQLQKERAILNYSA